MAIEDVNSVVLVARLTRDPELRSTASGTSVTTLRVAFDTRRKVGDAWESRPNYVDVVVWGKMAENCTRYLAKGRQIAIKGRLEWREWEAKEGGKRQTVEVVAENVQFLSSGDGSNAGGQSGSDSADYVPPDSGSDIPAADPVPAGSGGGGDSDDIPFAPSVL